MTAYVVSAFRISTGEHVKHLDKTFARKSEAQAHALAANCKAFTPFYFTAKESI